MVGSGVADAGLEDCAPSELEEARARFARLIDEKLYPGGQLAIRLRGREIVRWAGGMARGLRDTERVEPAPMRDGTLVPVFSAGKPLAAFAIMLLEEQGKLDVNEPVAQHIPGFDAFGKGELTVLDVLTHRSGVLSPELITAPERWIDLARLRSSLAGMRPKYRRGTLAYAPFEYGWLLGAVVESVSSLPFPEFVRQNIALPADLNDLWFSVPPTLRDGIARVYWLGPPRLMVAGCNAAENFEETNNSAAFFDADVPGAGLVTNAATLAASYDLWLPGIEGPRLVADATLKHWLAAPRMGWDKSNGVPLRVGRGVLFGTWFPSVYGMWRTSDVFGHAGAFGVLAAADPTLGLSIACVTNGHRGRNELVRDFAPVVSAARKACLRIAPT